MKLFPVGAGWLFSLRTALAFGSPNNEHQKPLKIEPIVDWATRHMAEEHGIDSFDRASFFSLHDYDENGSWDVNEILKTYGMDDPSARDVPVTIKNEITRTLLSLLDTNTNNVVEESEFLLFDGPLPDFGLGPGHHWDIETEYQIHHWNVFHDENTKEEDLTHPEDIEHFRLHEQYENEAKEQTAMDKLTIVQVNIPNKFRKDLSK
ncbi:hypothetical protein K3495_g10454 [Podosphaera aphanis]|nr:hypothetical protein K3495_g10454 [Podosphaera aphanis]